MNIKYITNVNLKGIPQCESFLTQLHSDYVSFIQYK